MNTPVLETKRLILRPFRQDDARTVYECWESDPDVAKYMFWTSHNDIEKTKEWILYELGQIEKEDWFRFAIVKKETDELIGTVLIYYEEEVQNWEIAYNLGKKLEARLCNRGSETSASFRKQSTWSCGGRRKICKRKSGVRKCNEKAWFSI